VKPRASFTLNPPKIAPGYQVTFDASSSTAEGYGDTITSYSWDFGDTVHATGKIVTHTYSAVNNYIVKLNVTDNEGFWNTTTRIAEITIEHNSAIIDIQALSQVYNSWNAPITVKAKNRGTVNDSFNVTLKINGTEIGKQLISNLVPYGTKTLNFTWNTTGTLLLHNYTLEAISDTLPGETQTGDNSRTFGPILIRLIGDARFDRRINILDVVAVTAIYGSRSGDPTWDIMSDLAPDGKIDVLDVVKVTSRYGQTY
jgi:PKD repeat protein